MIEKLVLQREGEVLDFKQSITSLSKIAKTIVSFANTKGGEIIIGVRDDRTVSGIDPEEEKYMLNQAAEFYCKPPIPIAYEEEEIEDEGKLKTVLTATIEESGLKPHFARNNRDEWIAYVRVKDQSLPAGRTQIKLLNKIPEATELAAASLSRHEKALLTYLDAKDRITLVQFMKLKNFSKRRALRMLTDLVSGGFIRIHEHEKEPYYTR